MIRPVGITLLVSGMLLATTPALSGQPLAPRAQAASQDNSARLVAGAKRAAARAERAIALSQEARRAFAQSKSEADVRALLLKQGFTAEQLRHAKLVIIRAPGSSVAPASRIYVKVSVTCCPLRIEIIIRMK